MWKLSRHILELSFANLRTKNAGNHLQRDNDIYLKVKLNADLCNVCDGTAYLCDSEVLESEGPKVKVAHRRLKGYDVLGSPGSILLTYSRYSTRYHVYRNIFISWDIVNSSHWGTWGNDRHNVKVYSYMFFTKGRVRHCYSETFNIFTLWTHGFFSVRAAVY